ncbi:MAG: peptidylprolyl isomerase [Magnetococcales bacterium]|nr:peptidylprolyl isomerase [Magnetococcales bacterium]
MSLIKNGDIIAIHYTGILEDGQVFDSSIARGEPLRFTVGDAEIIPGLEKELLGMEAGQSKRVFVGMNEAYGAWMDDLVRDFPRELFPDDSDLEPGLRFSLSGEGGEQMYATVVEVNGDVITLDANHPLAGENLIFDVEILEVVPDSD